MTQPSAKSHCPYSPPSTTKHTPLLEQKPHDDDDSTSNTQQTTTLPSSFVTFFHDEIHFFANLVSHPDTPHILRSHPTHLQNLIDQYNMIVPSFRIPVPLHTLSIHLQYLWRIHAFEKQSYLADIERQFGYNCSPNLSHVDTPINYDPEVKEDEERYFVSSDLFGRAVETLDVVEYLFDKNLSVDEILNEFWFWKEHGRLEKERTTTCDVRVCEFVEKVFGFYELMGADEFRIRIIDDHDGNGLRREEEEEKEGLFFVPERERRRKKVVRWKDWFMSFVNPPMDKKYDDDDRKSRSSSSSGSVSNIILFCLIAFMIIALICVLFQPQMIEGVHLNRFIARRGGGSGHGPRLPPSHAPDSWQDMQGTDGHSRRLLQTDTLTQVTIALAVILACCAAIVLIIFLCACCRNCAAGGDGGAAGCCDQENLCPCD